MTQSADLGTGSELGKDAETVTDAGRWRMLALLAMAVLLGMSLWFSGSAVAPALAERWTMTPQQSAWLTSLVQLGFVVGTATVAVLNLADIMPARFLFAGAAAAGAVSNAGLLVAPSYEWGLATRFLVGFFLAGVYPPSMKMISSWFRERRGLAIGALVGALTVGNALPFLVRALGGAAIEPTVLVVSASALLASLLVLWGFRDGPYPFARRPFSWGLAGTVLRERRWRLVTGGYLGHMWELYSYWAWIAVFIAASAEARAAGMDGALSPAVVGIFGFAAIAVGGIGCVWGGLVADRVGHARFVIWAMAVSGSCAALVGFFFGGTMWLLMPLVLVWGFFVIADSAQFSTMVTTSVPQHAVGTALTLQTSLGFLLTMVTIQLVPTVVQVAGWRWSFAVLALGPAAGIAAIRRLQAGAR